jgi:hypothetical protein
LQSFMSNAEAIESKDKALSVLVEVLQHQVFPK